MLRLNEVMSEEKERELIGKLYNYMRGEIVNESIDNDIENDYLTCNKGFDGKEYFWYLDASRSVAIDMDGNIKDEEHENESLKGILYYE